MLRSHERWARIRELFFAELEADPSSRASRLRAACEGDESLAQEVEQLLELAARPCSILDRPACDCPSLLALLSRPASAFQQQLRPADIIADRFHVLSLIGIGGMGEVYEARDELLGGTVALKIVRPDIESVEVMAERLRREAQLARRVTHSSVCRVHDVIPHVFADGRAFLVLIMERLHGYTLRQRLETGSLPMQQALDIARQVAAGLDAAHAEGVLHRDVKPENIILEPRADRSYRAVLTDFGLAHPSIVESGLERMTQTGMLAGTPAYMAPELLRGDAPSVRSDIFAFGVVVREMLGATPISSAFQRHVLQRALSHDPEDRFPTARKLVDALTAPPAAPTLFLPTPPPDKVRASILGLVPLIGMALYLYLADVSPYALARAFFASTTTTHVPKASLVIFTDLVNETNERSLDGASEVLRSQLAQSPHFELMGRDRVSARMEAMQRAPGRLPDAEDARIIAGDVGAPFVIAARLRPSARGYVLRVELELVSTYPGKYQPWSRDFSAEFKHDLFGAMHDAAVWVREMLGERPSELQAQNRIPAETASVSWDALRLYAQAESLMATGRAQFAVATLNEAVQVDPEFATAYVRLGDFLMALKRDREGYVAWQRAIAALDKKQLTTREAMRIRVRYFEETGDVAEVERVYRAYVTRYPNDFSPLVSFGIDLLERGLAPESIEWFDKASKIRPRALEALVPLSLACLESGRSGQAAQSIAAVSTISTEWTHWLQALAMLANKNVQEALLILEPLRTTGAPPWRSRASLVRASWLSELGNDAAAAAELHAGISYDVAGGLKESEADKRLALADLQLRSGQRQASLDSAGQALGVATSARRLAIAGALAARAGDIEQAKMRLSEFDNSFPADRKAAIFKQRLIGEIKLAEGDAAAAVSALSHVVAVAPGREHGLSLARALLQTGDAAGAERALRETASHPTRLYTPLEPVAPGLWRQAVVSLLAVVERRDPPRAAELRTLFRALLQPQPAADEP